MSHITRIALLVSAITISGCAPQMQDLVEYTAQVRQTATVSIEPYPEFTSQPVFKYQAQDLRSPFVRPQARTAAATPAPKKNCLQPNYARAKTVLEQYGIDALSLSGSFTSNGQQWVLFSANDGTLHKATMGTHLGLYYGKISQITPQSVVITELVPDGAGCWQQKETTLAKHS